MSMNGNKAQLVRALTIIAGDILEDIGASGK